MLNCFRVFKSVVLFSFGVGLVGCSSYRQNIMFRPATGFAGNQIQKEALQAERNYLIQVNDYLKMEVFSNKGERIIDPNGELLKSMGGVNQNMMMRTDPNYLVALDGTVKFPMIEVFKLEGLTIRQAEQLLQKEYDRFYKECYVILTFANKRVVVLGATGGQVIPLLNENVKLAEVLALAKGFGNEGIARNIRLIRGEEVYLVDFSTIDGLHKGNMIVQPGDIIYVEPLRRPFVEGFRDYSPIVSFVLSLSTLILVFTNTGN